MSASASASKPSGTPPRVSRPGADTISASFFNELAARLSLPERSLHVLECPDTGEKRRIVLGGHVFAPGDPVVKRRVLDTDQALELIDLGFGKGIQGFVREVAQDQVHFLDAPMPGSEPEPPQARVPVERAVIFGHVSLQYAWAGYRP